jgi:arylsulfatase A-like enzyme
VTYEQHHDYKVVRSGIEVLPKLAKGDKPWMLYIGPVGPHDPFRIPEKFAKMHDPKKIELPPSF